MEKAIQRFEYNGKTVSFDLDNEDVLVDATAMAKVFGKKPNDFLKLNQTQTFIKQLVEEEQYRCDPESQRPIKNDVFNTENTDRSEDLMYKIVQTRTGGDGQGTWMHEILALKFAAWLNPKFEIWVYRKIKELMDNLRANDEVFKERVRLEDKISALRKKLQGNPDFQQYALLTEQISKLPSRVKLNNRNQLNLHRTLRQVV